MSSYPLVKYVDSPATTATVRYDFNDQTGTPAKKVTDFDPGVPTLEGDPDAVGQQWGFRSPSIVHTIKGTKAQAMAALSAVSKEQLRHTNWLMFQPSAATQPVWFKTYRTGYQPITLDQVYVRVDGGGSVPLADTWKITVPLVADAFAYGARVTIPTAQIIQSPADLTGPTRLAMRYNLPTIKGDAPTPLRVAVTTTAGNTAYRQATWLIGCLNGAATIAPTVVDVGTGDIFSTDNGTSAPVTDATYFGGSYRTVNIGVGSGVAVRLYGSLPALAPGRYKVMARCTLASAKTFLLRLDTMTGYPGRVVSMSGIDTHARQQWVDLGDHTVPFGTNLPADISAGSSSAPNWGLFAGTTDNSAGAFNIDSFLLVPVDGPTIDSAYLMTLTGDAHSALSLSNGVVGTFDGDDQVIWLTSGGAFQDGPGSLAGGFPIADPASKRNVLLLVATDNGPYDGSSITAPFITSLNAQAAVVISYYPRYLHLGDGT